MQNIQARGYGNSYSIPSYVGAGMSGAFNLAKERRAFAMDPNMSKSMTQKEKEDALNALNRASYRNLGIIESYRKM